jgi:hypothetical protein
MVSDPCSRHEPRVFQEIAYTSAILMIKTEASMHEGRGLVDLRFRKRKLSAVDALLERLALGMVKLFSDTVTNITSISSRGLKGNGGARTFPVEVLVASRAPCKEISVGELPAKVDLGVPQTKRRYVDCGLTIDELCYTTF